MDTKKDVNQEIVAPDSAKAPVDTTKVEGTKEDVNLEPEKVEEDLNRSIPYSRFKEVLDAKKEQERKVKELEKVYNDKLVNTQREIQTYYETELAKMQRLAQDPYATVSEPDPTETKFGSVNQELTILKTELERLKNESETQKINGEINKLKSVYPDMDDEHVFAVKKMKPDWTLEECAEYSHSKYGNLVKTRLNKLIEAKKEAAKKQVLVSDGKISLTPEQKPKTKEEARKAYMNYMQQRDRLQGK